MVKQKKQQSQSIKQKAHKKRGKTTRWDLNYKWIYEQHKGNLKK